MLTFFWPPKYQSGIWRPMKFAKYMPQHGWKPTVLTAKFPLDKDAPCVREDNIPPCEVIRVEPNSDRTLARAMSWAVWPMAKLLGKNRQWVEDALEWRMAWSLQWPDRGTSCNRWMIPMLSNAMDLLAGDRFDAVYVTAPPVQLTLVAAVLAMLRPKPIIMDLRDPWTQEFQYTQRGFRRGVDEWVEKSCLRRCDRIVTVTPMQTADLSRLYPELTGKLRCITNGFDPEDILPRNVRVPDGRLIVTYCGMSYEKLDQVTQAVRLACQRREAFREQFEMRWIGPQPRHPSAEEVAPIKYLGILPKNDAMRITQETDVLWFEVPINGHSRYIYPGKMFEYMVMDRPIIGTIPEGACMEKLLHPMGYCRFCYSRDPEKMAALLDQVFDDWQAGKLAGGASAEARAEHVRRFRRDVLTGQLCDVLNEVTRGSRRRHDCP
ncbi:MAG: glycosyltransferase [Phycisphaerae bacterium]|nr:glycosyltransferase [Phycisphaerae bacterium]